MPPPPPLDAVIRPFDPPDAPYGAGHRGIDLAIAPNAAVRSLTAGVVRFAGLVAGVPVVTVGLPDGRRVTYQPVTAQVRLGQLVDPGTVLGTVPGPGASGGHCALAGCIHLGLRLGSAYLDPTVLLSAPRPAALKPR